MLGILAPLRPVSKAEVTPRRDCRMAALHRAIWDTEMNVIYCSHKREGRGGANPRPPEQKSRELSGFSQERPRPNHLSRISGERQLKTISILSELGLLQFFPNHTFKKSSHFLLFRQIFEQGI